MNIKKYLEQRKRLIDEALARALPKEKEYPSVIHRAMRYSVLGEGKRIRPILTLAAAEAYDTLLERGTPPKTVSVVPGPTTVP